MSLLSAIFVLKVLIGILISPAASLSPSNANTLSSADIKDYPYHVAVEFTNLPVFACAGAIISKNYVLATAHCVKHEAVDDIIIRAGTTTRLKDGIIYNAEAVTIHEDYKLNDDGWSIHDIALVRIKGTFKFDASHQSIELFSPGERIQAGASANVTAWDGIYELIDLKATHATVIDSETCNQAFSEDHGIPSKVICAGMGPCYGPGDPIAFEGRLAGLASLHLYHSCGVSYPGTFTEVASYRDWIDQHVEYSERNGAERL